MSEFLKKTLIGIVSKKEIDNITRDLRKLAIKNEISLDDFVDSLFNKFSQITHTERSELLLNLIGDEN